MNGWFTDFVIAVAALLTAITGLIIAIVAWKRANALAGKSK